ncbi:MAG: DUF6580 family putative transport protein [Candidatus Omnitrophota bacterium]
MIAYILIVMGFMMRVLPHAPNVAPVAAIALFSGAYLNKKLVPWVPLIIMAASDLIIGLHSVVAYTWGSFIIIGYIGMWLGKHKTPGFIALASIGSALLFFVISNFGVWLSWYPHNVDGFIACYVNAVPFLRNTMASNLIFTFVLFGAYELAGKLVKDGKFRDVLLVRG